MMEKGRDSFSRRIEKSARELAAARRERRGLWRYATLIGTGGWLFALPVVAGAYLGRFLDRRIEDGTSWTVTLMLVGIGAGIYNLWRFLFGREE